MTIGAILGAIGALGAIAGLFTYLVKTGVWIFKTTPESQKEQIDQKVNDEESKFNESGRPS